MDRIASLLGIIVLLTSNNWYTLYKREKMTTFQSLGLPAEILSAIERLNFTAPTPIQAQTIPLALEGHDVLGSAQTGTGKTAAFS